MSRSTKSLAVALWGTVLSCCVWSVHASQAVVHATVPHNVVGAEQSQETRWQQELTRSLTSLVYWSDLLQTRTTDLGKLSIFPAEESRVFTQNNYRLQSCLAALSGLEDLPHTFVLIRNRWSYGFH